jgi:hypothetical protein
LRAGDAWPQSAVEYAREVGEMGEEEDDDPDRWLWGPLILTGRTPVIATWSGSSRDLDDAEFADRLARAIAGSGASRRFKDRLSERPHLITG